MIPFLENISQSSIYSELIIIQQAYQRSTSEYMLHPKSRDVEYPSLSVMKSALRQPFSADQSSHIATAWQHINQIDVTINDMVLYTKTNRFSIMSSTGAMWNWLNTHCVNFIRAVLTGIETDDSWIKRLVNIVRETVHNGICDRRIYPSDVDKDLTGEEYWFKMAYPVYGKDKQDRRIEAHVVTIIQQWLEYPTSCTSNYQGCFVSAIAQEWAPDVLYLDATWDAFHHIRAQVVGPFYKTSDMVRVFKPVLNAMQEHPLADPGSAHRVMVSSLSQFVVAFEDGDFSVPVSSDIGILDEEDTMALDDEDQSPDVPYRRDNTTTLMVDIDVDAPTDPTIIHNLQRLLDYVNELYPIISQPAKISPVPNPTKLQSSVLHDTDKLLPFRERAPSRTMMQQDVSPFSPSMARTRTGLFSALVWRGITYHTPFSLETSPVFDDIADWNSRLISMEHRPGELSMTKPESYFCDMAAYGRSNPQRTVQLADSYWEASNSTVWTAMVEKEIVPFSEGYKFFTDTHPNRFSQIGSLAGYLLTADFVYAGVIAQPTLAEMGDMVYTINKGAVSGLVKLGLINPLPAKRGFRKGNKNDYMAAIECVFSHLSSHLSDEKKKRMGLDLIMVEHLLCKFHRAISKGFFKL